MAEAELMILPDVSMNDLKRTMDRIDGVMKDSAKKAGNEFRQELAKGITKGIKEGRKKLGGGIQAGYDKVGGAGGIMAGMMAAMTAGFASVIARADAGTALIEARMDASNAPALTATGEATGLSAGETLKLWKMAQRAGFEDAGDFSEMMTNILIKVREAEAGEDPLLTQFKGMRGIELYEAVLGSLAQADKADRLMWMDKLELGEQLPQMTVMLKEINETATENGKINAGWLKLTVDETKNGLAMLLEEQKVLAFREERFRAEEQRARAENAAITNDTIKAWGEEQNRITQQQANIIRGYQANLSAAAPARDMMEISNKLLMQIAMNTAPLLSKDAKMVGAAMEGNWDTFWWHLTGGRDFITGQKIPQPRIGG